LEWLRSCRISDALLMMNQMMHQLLDGWGRRVALAEAYITVRPAVTGAIDDFRSAVRFIVWSVAATFVLGVHLVSLHHVRVKTRMMQTGFNPEGNVEPTSQSLEAICARADDLTSGEDPVRSIPPPSWADTRTQPDARLHSLTTAQRVKPAPSPDP
jgi:hypothetical protein